MNRIIFVLALTLLIAGCKSKKEKKKDTPVTNFFPVPVYIRGELARLDTSEATFYKIETINDQADTVVIRNTEVRQYAKDFLELPDISSPELKDDYEPDHLYDELQEAFVFTFTTKENHKVRQENITVDPDVNAEGKNDIKSIYVDFWDNKEDTFVRKNMLWEANRSFQITTTTEAPGTAATIKRIRIIWNGFEGQNNREISK